MIIQFMARTVFNYTKGSCSKLFSIRKVLIIPELGKTLNVAMMKRLCDYFKS